ncbi:MAG: hypothetical protein AUH85_12180 [Chloroflexi bacterium 13_1_40CM_4_68_4]|nr:MAG: hypothetical protein AUH85_12180 [Chloroflexi bacterium 13_1_40CM_4_68_4]
MNGATPSRHVAPTSVDEVAATVREADGANQAIVCFGGRTRLDVGNAPARYDVALDLAALSGVVEHEAGDLTATVLAGTTVGELTRTLAAKGQMWPVEVARPQLATVGGVLAGAAPGPSRLRYAHPRDWVLGVRAVLGDGTLTKAGGKVVKNVSGYDLTRLYAGTYGSLCVIVEANLKLWPLADAERTLLARFDDVAKAWSAVATMRRDGTDIDAVVTADHAAASYVGEIGALAVVRLRGARPVITRLADAVSRALAAADLDDARPGLLEELIDVPFRSGVALRIAAPESRMREVLEGATGVVRLDGTGTAFLVREQADESWVKRWRDASETRDGSAVLERAPLTLRQQVDAWGIPVLPRALAARIKVALDPRSTLAPGRMPGGL